MIVKTAALSSLSTTPIKDLALRQMILTTFGKPKLEIDFGIRLFEVSEEEEDDYIIIEQSGRAGGQLLGDDEVGAAKIVLEGYKEAEGFGDDENGG
ncbi:hypothetical protein VE02_02293 [Pseudogymnoascus sp. 03VT05]|nr:hypothetical protein VE02_02293 [Pseudogymnoascus sp. 03VT05]